MFLIAYWRGWDGKIRKKEEKNKYDHKDNAGKSLMNSRAHLLG